MHGSDETRCGYAYRHESISQAGISITTFALCPHSRSTQRLAVCTLVLGEVVERTHTVGPLRC